MAQSPAKSTVLDFSREDEHQLKELRRRVDDPNCDPLAPQEQSDLLMLEQKYARFQEEGLRKLREGAERKSSDNAAASITGTVASVITGVARGALFWGSLIGTAAPGYLGKKAGLTNRYEHWNWITDRLILGALPVVTQIGSSGNHLMTIGEQCAFRNTRIGLVVSAITTEEIHGFGIAFPRFAAHEDWQQQLGVRRFELVEIADMTAGVDYETVFRVIEKMHIVMTEAQEAVYVHCKAGKGRSWMVVMCYLCTFGRKTFAQAEAMVQEKRHQVSPSSSQTKFVHDFAARFAAGEMARQLLSQPGAAGPAVAAGSTAGGQQEGGLWDMCTS